MKRTERDELSVEVALKALSNNVLSHAMGYYSAEKFINIGDVKVSCQRQRDGATVSCYVFPLAPEMQDDDIVKYNLIVLFDSPLEVGSEYLLKYSSIAEEVLFDLVEEGKDVISYTLSEIGAADVVRLIARIPENFPAITLEPYIPKAGDARHFVTGRQLTVDEICLLDATSYGFRSVGWEAKDLPSNGATGFVARLT